MRSSFLPKCQPKITRISVLIYFQGRNPRNFWFAFWEKRWPHKFILNLTDLQLFLIFDLVELKNQQCFASKYKIHSDCWISSYYFLNTHCLLYRIIQNYECPFSYKIYRRMHFYLTEQYLELTSTVCTAFSYCLRCSQRK